MNSAELRQCFLDFFKNRGHRVVASSPVIPHGDPTLLFTNAGMNQFKDVLLGREVRDYKRAASVQKCIRAGGKHNDLDEVGKDGRHLTCFEMLGNWSFGDYYKREAIEWAWEFVTERLALSPERLYVATYKDDEESRQIWREVVGVPEARITALGDIESGDEENFWSMGPTGPCGPCTEIYYDHHPELGPFEWGPGFDEERLLELWNLVFMEFDRDADGRLTPLPMQSVDTGMGLERTQAVLAQVDNVFHTDLFEPIILKTARMLGDDSPDAKKIQAREDYSSFAVIADHIRALTFSLADGGMFSNEGRGYVLRRILRRAVRFGRQLGFERPFLCDLAPVVSDTFGIVYPEVRATRSEISSMIRGEEERFFTTIDRGITRFAELADSTRKAGGTEIDGGEAFKLYDTYGFPLDLTQIMAEEEGLTVDTPGFDRALEAQQERARRSDNRYDDSGQWISLHEGVADRSLVGLETSHKTRILRARHNEKSDLWEILLAETPFYAEAGGQVGDRGFISAVDGRVRFEVIDTQQTPSGMTHYAKLVSGSPIVEVLAGEVLAEIDHQRRFLITCNHTATHLLHAALRQVVSKKAFQAGSMVAPERLRFDYSFNRPLSAEEIRSLEVHVNASIQAARPLEVHQELQREEAEAMGAIAIFGEKYGERVRVIQIPQTSIELCGGCHVQNTREIAYFRITSETGVAAGVRRIEAVTNLGAFTKARQEQDLLEQTAGLLKAEVTKLPQRAQRLLEEQQTLLKRNQSLAQRLASFEGKRLVAEAQVIDGVTCGAGQVDATTREELLYYIDAVRNHLEGPATVLIGCLIEGKPALACLVTEALFKSRRIKAGDLINQVAPLIGGRGGGRPTLAQAGGNQPENLAGAIEAFLAQVKKLIEKPQG